MKKIKELFNLKGKNALVTGSSRGIGKGIALGLAEYGANVMVHHYDSKRDHAEQTLNEINAFGVKSGLVFADLTDRHAADLIYNASRDIFKGIDILVLNASIQVRDPWDQITYNDFRRQTDINIGSTIWLIQKFVPYMKRNNWGRVITIGSVQQHRPHPEMLVYSATKMAMINMVRSLSPSFGKSGITINNIAPGVILTNRNKQALSNDQYAKHVLNKIPVGYFGESNDCAGLAILLSSDAGRYITGSDLLVDGGMNVSQ